jgi:DNA-binding MarR family transcriptional regulator
MIEETRVEGRRRSYLLTEKGRAALDTEARRMAAQLKDYAAAFGKEDVR